VSSLKAIIAPPYAAAPPLHRQCLRRAR
jgi:hypothetical protein